MCARYENRNVIVTASDGREFLVGDRTAQLARGGIALVPLDWQNPGPREPLTLRAEWGYDPQVLAYGTSDPCVGALAVLSSTSLIEEGPLDLPPKAVAEKVVNDYIRDWLEVTGKQKRSYD